MCTPHILFDTPTLFRFICRCNFADSDEKNCWNRHVYFIIIWIVCVNANGSIAATDQEYMLLYDPDSNCHFMLEINMLNNLMSICTCYVRCWRQSKMESLVFISLGTCVLVDENLQRKCYDLRVASILSICCLLSHENFNERRVVLCIFATLTW